MTLKPEWNKELQSEDMTVSGRTVRRYVHSIISQIQQKATV